MIKLLLISFELEKHLEIEKVQYNNTLFTPQENINTENH